MKSDVLVRWLCSCLYDRGERKTFVVWASCFKDACIVGLAHVDRSSHLVSVRLLENDQPVYIANCVH